MKIELSEEFKDGLRKLLSDELERNHTELLIDFVGNVQLEHYLYFIVSNSIMLRKRGIFTWFLAQNKKKLEDMHREVLDMQNVLEEINHGNNKSGQ